MATNKPVWGIDLGQNALKAVRVRIAGDTAEAIDYAYIEHARILSSQSDTAARAAMVAETMKKFLDQHNISKEPIVVAVPGQHTLARFTKLPPVDKKKIPGLVQYEAQQQIPFDMEEVIWDYQIFGNSPEGVEVGIFAMRREVLREHLRFLSDLNLEPAAVQSAPLALYNALKFDGIIGAEASVILDIGAQNSDLIISDGESLWTRNIPIGGNHFTEALLKTFKLSFNKAENLKRTAASSKYARQIFQAMRPVFADLVAEIQRSIGFFTGSRRNVKLAKVVAMGNAFQLPGMVKFIQQNLGMDVVRPTSFSRLSASEAPNAPELLKQLASFGVAYGLALQGLGKATITSSLLPPDIAKQIVWRKKTPWFYGAAACMVLSAGVIWGRTMLDTQAIASIRENAGPPPSFNMQNETINGVEVPKPDPSVFSALDSEPANPLAYAQTIDAAGKHLQQVISSIQTLNDAENQKAKDIAQLQAYNVLWPKILFHLHASLPPEDEVSRAIAAGPAQYKELVAANPEKYARKNRRLIFIEKMHSQYSNDVIPLWNDATGRGPVSGGPGNPMAAGGASPGQPTPGFFVTIEGRSPMAWPEGCSLVNDVFMANLRKVATAPKRTTGGAASPSESSAEASTEQHIYFDKVYLLQCESAAKILGGGGMGGQVGDQAAGDQYKDPVTGEPTTTDTMFRLVFVVGLGEKPADQASAAPVSEENPQ